MHARRATPMYLVEDLDDARLRYVSLGFVPKDTDDEGCCGVSAGPTHIILLDRDYAERSLPPRAVTLLEERPALYIRVESLEGLRAELRGTFLGEIKVSGLREWAFEGEQGLVVFAEGATLH
jgi:hypothetical protein